MKKRKKKIKLITLTAIAAITAVAVGLLCLTASEEIQECMQSEAPVPLNHIITDDMSDLPEAKRFDAAILRFMRYWDIKGGSFALMKNDSLIYAK